MFTRLIEALLVHAGNRLADGRDRPAKPRRDGLSHTGDPAGQADQAVLLGHTLPLPSAASFPFVPPEQQGTGATVTLSPEARLRHLYAIGSTGCGKTTLLLNLISSDIQAGRTFCVVDLRGDLVDRILPRLAASKRFLAGNPDQFGERLLLLDLRRPDHTVGFNPLAGSGDAHSRALFVLDVLRRQSDSWGVQLEETLRNALVALAETGWSLLEVEPLLSRAPFRARVVSQVTDGHVRAFFARYGALSEDKQSQWRLPVLNKVTPLLSLPPLRRVLGQRQGVPFGTLLDTPGQVILVSLAVDRLHGAAHLLGGLLVSALQGAVMARVDSPPAARNPVHLYIDEFETMASERFETILAEGRRFGLGLTLSHQNLTQLDPKLRQVVLNNAQTQLYFQTGSGDAAELAPEVMTSLRREDVRSALVRQPVGEAFLVRRGQESVRLKVPHSPDPEVDPGRVAALVAASLGAHARPQCEVERELAERETSECPLASPEESPARRTSAHVRSRAPAAASPVPAATPPGASVIVAVETTEAGGVAPDLLSEPESDVPRPPRAAPAVAPVYQIRHGKTARFAPREPETNIAGTQEAHHD